MGLALGPNCCCGGPGIQRSIGLNNGLFINPADDLKPGGLCLKHWPCWATPFDGFDGCSTLSQIKPLGSATFGYDLLGYSILGYNARKNTVVFATLLSSYVFPYTFYTSDGDEPAVIEARVFDCQLTGATSGGQLVFDSRITADDSLALQTATVIPIGGSGDRYSSWIGITDDRLYALTYCRTSIDFGAQGIFLVWSTDYDGTDYQLEHEFDCSVFGDPALPTHANICNGTVYYADGDNNLYQSGGSLGAMSGLVQPMAAANVTSQVLCLGVSSGTNTLVIFQGGVAPATNAVGFVVLNDDDEEVTFIPYSISYDQLHRSIVVVWRGTFDTNVFNPNRVYVTYVTYIAKDIAPGNIVGQDGVSIYGIFPGGSCGRINTGAFGGTSDIGAASEKWSVIIEGKMPRPVKVTAGHLEPPPPPTPTCDDYILCGESQPLTLNAIGFADHTQTISLTDFIDGITIHSSAREWFNNSLNGNFTLTDVAALPGGVIPHDGGRPGDGISTPPGYKLYWVPIGEFESYSDPGIKLFTTTYDTADAGDPADYHWERYVCGLIVSIYCSEGVGTIGDIYLEWQDFKGVPGASDPPQVWPPTAAHIGGISAPLVIEDVAVDVRQTGVSGVCTMTGMRTIFHFAELNEDSTDGPNSVSIFCQAL